MKSEYHSIIKWHNGEKNDHQVEIDLDLIIDDFLKGKNLAFELNENEIELRKKLIDLILNKILREAVEVTGMPWGIEGKYEYTSNYNITNAYTVSDP